MCSLGDIEHKMYDDGKIDDKGRIVGKLYSDNPRYNEFLLYLLDTIGYSSKELSGVLQKPWHWTNEFNEWAATNVQR